MKINRLKPYFQFQIERNMADFFSKYRQWRRQPFTNETKLFHSQKYFIFFDDFLLRKFFTHLKITYNSFLKMKNYAYGFTVTGY